MNFSKFGKQLEKLIIDNSPAILTAIGVVGIASTAYLTHKAAFRSAEVLYEEDSKRILHEKETGETAPILSKSEMFKLTWKFYVPAVTSGGATIACIIFANRISARRAAALAAAYTLSEKRITEYKDKVAEKIGLKKEEAVRDELAQDKVNQNPVNNRQVIITGNGDVLCYDIPSDRYFKSNVETIRKAENDINAQTIGDDYSPLSDLYMLLKLPTTRFSEEVGWTIEKMLEIQFSTVMSDDNQPCIAIDYAYIPIRGSKSPDE